MMAFGGFGQTGQSRPMAEINIIPLVDVMLVLLIIFIITAPLLTHAVKIDLPKAASHPNITRPDNVQVAINGEGTIFWNGEPIPFPEVRKRLQAAAQREPQPELHLRADRAAQYQTIAWVMSEAARAGLTRIGFVTEPDGRE